MAHLAYELEVQPLSNYWGNGGDKVGHIAWLFTPDAAAVVEAANYLNASVKRLPKGTIIHAAMALGGTPVLKSYVVTANSGTAVTIALQATAAG